MGRILPIELKEIDASVIDSNYTNFGAPLANPAVKINFINTGDQDIYVAQEENVMYLRVPANGTLTLDESFLYRNGIDQEYYFPRGTQLLLTQTLSAPTAGYLIAHIVTRIQP